MPKPVTLTFTDYIHHLGLAHDRVEKAKEHLDTVADTIASKFAPYEIDEVITLTKARHGFSHIGKEVRITDIRLCSRPKWIGEKELELFWFVKAVVLRADGEDSKNTADWREFIPKDTYTTKP